MEREIVQGVVTLDGTHHDFVNLTGVAAPEEGRQVGIGAGRIRQRIRRMDEYPTKPQFKRGAGVARKPNTIEEEGGWTGDLVVRVRDHDGTRIGIVCKQVNRP